MFLLLKRFLSERSELISLFALVLSLQSNFAILWGRLKWAMI